MGASSPYQNDDGQDDLQESIDQAEVPPKDLHNASAWTRWTATSKRVFLKWTNIAESDWEGLRKKLAYLPMHIVQATFEATTQLLSKADKRLPLRRHFKSRFPQANFNRLHETFSTDTMFSSTKAMGGDNVPNVQ